MGIKILVKNRKAFHEYEVMDRFEAGIALLGTEVKSLRAAKVNLTDGWVDIDDDAQAFLRDVHIGHYSHGNINNHDELRPRRLLMKRKEINKLSHQIAEKGFALIPIKVYLKGQFVKVEIALARGKKLHDKRQSARKKEADRDIQRAMKNR